MKKAPSKKTLKAKLKIKADKLFSQCCFKKWGNICICGREASATHHFFPKSGSAYLRYNLDNGVPLCYGCHIIKIHTQGDPETLERIKKARGLKWYNNLKRLKKKGLEAKSITTVKYYQEVIMALEEYLKRY
jgi:5-methylcytosine-specific restriction endonuclease McrA